MVQVHPGPPICGEFKNQHFSEGDSWCDKKMGGLAQLVERLLCKQEVSGSTPLSSTNIGNKVVFEGLSGKDQ